MSKIIMYANKLLAKVTGHRYTGFTVKMPFINLSFAPAPKHRCRLYPDFKSRQFYAGDFLYL